MKNKVAILGIILFFSVLMMGCKNVALDTNKKIVPPHNETNIIKGTWEFEDYKIIRNKNIKKNNFQNIIGKKAFFTDNYAAIGDEVCRHAKYKIKTVDTKKFFLNDYEVYSEKLGIEIPNVEVISITSKDKHFYDVIRISKNEMIVSMYDSFFYLKKISDNVKDINKKENNSVELNKEIKENVFVEDSLLRTGVLLGLRYDEPNAKGNKDFNKSSSYRTLWISSKNRTTYPVMQLKKLFVPRISGFWVAGVNEFYKNGYLNENLYSYSLEEKGYSEVNFSEDANILRKILFIGNDYIGIQYNKDNNSEHISNVLKVIPIDRLYSDKGVKISEVMGEGAKQAFKLAEKEHVLSLDKEKNKGIEVADEENFTMERINGHWIVKGRIFNRGFSENKNYEDFALNIIPTGKLINFDDLYIPWNEIKEKVPSAEDAFTSPNRDLLIIISKEYMYVYTFKDNSISPSPVQKIKLKKGEKVIMAEWSRGEYMEKWFNTVKQFGEQLKD